MPELKSKANDVFQLSIEALKVVDEIAAMRGGISREEVIRDAIGQERFFQGMVRNGGRIFIEHPHNVEREVFLPK